jgi:predicted ATPase
MSNSIYPTDDKVLKLAAKKPVKIVLTGGPCGGKTTVMDHLKENLKSRAVFVPETATRLFEEGLLPQNSRVEEWGGEFQGRILLLQDAAEAQAEKQARELYAHFVICDRGALDGAAYVVGGLPEFSRKYNVWPSNYYKEYRLVIHLESLATLNPKEYERLVFTNPHRFETVEVAVKRELALRQAWANHPRRELVSLPIDEAKERVLSLIASLYDV